MKGLPVPVAPCGHTDSLNELLSVSGFGHLGSFCLFPRETDARVSGVSLGPLVGRDGLGVRRWKLFSEVVSGRWVVWCEPMCT